MASLQASVFAGLTAAQWATLGFGALLGFSTTTLGDILDRRRRRRALATAMLLELEALEPNFRRMAADESAGTSSFSLWYEVIARTSDSIALFRPRAVHSVLLLKYRLDEIRDDVTQYEREKAAGVEVPKRTAENRTWARRSACVLIVKLCIEVRQALVREGGTMPPPVAEIEWNEPEIPPLPPPHRPATGWRRFLPARK